MFRIKTLIFGFLCVLGVFCSCVETDDGMILWLDSSLIKCGDPMDNRKCLKISRNEMLESAKWEIYPYIIEGLSFEVGSFQKIRVKEEKDSEGSIIKVTFIEKLESKKDPVFELNGIWSALKITGVESLDTVDLPRIQVNLHAERIMGYNTCNNFIAQIISVDKSGIDIGKIVTQKKYCDDHIVPLAFNNTLDATSAYKLEEAVLYFYDEDGTELVRFSKS